MRYFFFLIILVSISCSEATYTEKAVTMMSHAGQRFMHTDYIPAPFGHGYISNSKGDSLEVIVLGNTSDVDRIEIKPLSAFSLIHGSNQYQFIIALPLKTALQTMPLIGFRDFVVKENAAKVIIDQYLSNFKGLGQTRVTEWQSAEEAHDIINQFIR